MGYLISDDLSDDSDTKRKKRDMFVHVNTLCRRFSRCSFRVKVILFRAYGICLYDTALLKQCLVTTKSSFKSYYNRCMKLFFGFKKYDRVTNKLVVELSSFATILHN